MEKQLSVKNMYLLLVVSALLIVLAVGSTYAVFTVDKKIESPIVFSSTLTSEDGVIDTIDITLESREYKKSTLTINNTSSSDLNYTIWYISSDSDIEIGMSDSISSGSIAAGDSIVLNVDIQNYEYASTNVILGVSSGVGDIVLSDEMNIISNDEISDKISPTLVVDNVSDTTSDSPTYSSTASYTVSGTVNDNISISSVTVNGESATIVDSEWNVTLTLTANVLTTLDIVATDTSGNQTSITEYVFYDNTAPTLTFSQTLSTSSYCGTYVYVASGGRTNYTFSGTASDASGIKSVTINGTEATIVDGNWSLTRTFSGTSSKALAIRFIVTDNAGLTRTYTRYIHYGPIAMC